MALGRAIHCEGVAGESWQHATVVYLCTYVVCMYNVTVKMPGTMGGKSRRCSGTCIDVVLRMGTGAGNA